jgi:hypothetical protein
VRHPSVPGADDVIAAVGLGGKLARTRRDVDRAAGETHHSGVTGSARSSAVGAIARHLKLRLGVPFEPNRLAKIAARDAHRLIDRSI